jgi:PAS domain S-box-containing protein
MYPSLPDVQQFYQEIIDCAAEGIIVCDRELRYQVWNRFMEQLTGRRAEEALGKSAVELFPSLRENAMDAALSRALQGEVVTDAGRLSADAEDRSRRLGILYLRSSSRF